MAVKPAVKTTAGKAPAKEKKPGEGIKVEVLDDNTIVNGHKLKKGSVTEMSLDDIVKHRNAGVCLGDVGPDDKREVIDTSEPYVAKDGGEDEDEEDKDETDGDK